MRFLFLLPVLIVVGCCGPRPSQLTPFPPAPSVTYSQDPVIRYNRRSKTYEVTSEMVENATLNQVFIDEIMNWKRQNSIR